MSGAEQGSAGQRSAAQSGAARGSAARRSRPLAPRPLRVLHACLLPVTREGHYSGHAQAPCIEFEGSLVEVDVEERPS